MYYIVSEICIGGCFLEDCFYCYFQQTKLDVANEFLIPYNLIKMARQFFLRRELLFIGLKLGIRSDLKMSKETIKTF